MAAVRSFQDSLHFKMEADTQVEIYSHRLSWHGLANMSWDMKKEPSLLMRGSNKMIPKFNNHFTV